MNLVFAQKIDLTRIVKGTGNLSICDGGPPDEDGNFEVINQRDWKIPEFKDTANKSLCAAFNCNNECVECIVTRLLEENV